MLRTGPGTQPNVSKTRTLIQASFLLFLRWFELRIWVESMNYLTKVLGCHSNGMRGSHITLRAVCFGNTHVGYIENGPRFIPKYHYKHSSPFLNTIAPVRHPKRQETNRNNSFERDFFLFVHISRFSIMGLKPHFLFGLGGVPKSAIQKMVQESSPPLLNIKAHEDTCIDRGLSSRRVVV